MDLGLSCSIEHSASSPEVSTKLNHYLCLSDPSSLSIEELFGTNTSLETFSFLTSPEILSRYNSQWNSTQTSVMEIVKKTDITT